MKDIKIHYIPQSQFDTLKKILKPAFDKDNVDEDIAYTITMGDKVVIFINTSMDLTPDEKQIVLQHEMAHANGIDGEEDADKWALKRLSDKQKDILIDQWKDRHGHDYK